MWATGEENASVIYLWTLRVLMPTFQARCAHFCSRGTTAMDVNNCSLIRFEVWSTGKNLFMMLSPQSKTWGWRSRRPVGKLLLLFIYTAIQIPMLIYTFTLMLLSVLGVKSLLSVNGKAVNADSWFLMVLGKSESWMLRPKQSIYATSFEVHEHWGRKGGKKGFGRYGEGLLTAVFGALHSCCNAELTAAMLTCTEIHKTRTVNTLADRRGNNGAISLPASERCWERGCILFQICSHEWVHQVAMDRFKPMVTQMVLIKFNGSQNKTRSYESGRKWTWREGSGLTGQEDRVTRAFCTCMKVEEVHSFWR